MENIKDTILISFPIRTEKGGTVIRQSSGECNIKTIAAQAGIGAPLYFTKNSKHIWGKAPVIMLVYSIHRLALQITRSDFPFLRSRLPRYQFLFPPHFSEEYPRFLPALVPALCEAVGYNP